MMNMDERKQLISRFLAGEMQAKELEKFQTLIKEDPELRLSLDRESGAEAMLHDTISNPVSDIRYNTIVDKVIDPARDSKGGTQIWLRAYAIAATLVLAVLGAYYLNSQFIHAGAKALTANNEKGVLSVPENGKSITQLSSQAVLVSEEGTKARIFKDADSTVNVAIAQGNAFFDVSAQEGSHVNVVTPHSALAVHGTVFRVVVTELETEITVLEGTVEVVHRNHLDSPQLVLAGGTGLADCRNLQTIESLRPDVFERRLSMLRTYVGWVKQHMNG